MSYQGFAHFDELVMHYVRVQRGERSAMPARALNEDLQYHQEAQRAAWLRLQVAAEREIEHREWLQQYLNDGGWAERASAVGVRLPRPR